MVMTPQGMMAAIRSARLLRILLVYFGASFAALEAVDLLSDRIGLPDWLFPGAVALLIIGFPIIIATALVQAAPAAPVEPQRADDDGGSEPQAAPAAEVTDTARRWFTWRKAIMGGVVAFALLGVTVTGYMVMRVMGIGPVGSLVAKGAIAAGDRIILADFQSETGDTLLAAAATEAFRIDLSQSPVVTIAEPQYVGRVLQRMGRDPSGGLDPDLAREAAVREGLKATIEGEINSAGRGFVLSTRVVAADGTTLAAFRESADDSTEVIDAIDDLSKDIRERIGESLRTIRGSEPLAQVTTGSLEALRRYSQGVRALDAGDQERGATLLEEAVELDTTFAMAYRKLGLRALNASRRVEALTKAYEYRDRLTERERYLAMGTYYGNVTDDRPAAINAYRSLLEIYPNESTALNNLAVEYTSMRDFAGAEELYRRANQIDPSVPTFWRNIINIQVAQGDFDEADSTLARFGEALPGHPDVLDYSSMLASTRGDYDAAEAFVLELREAQKGSMLWQLNTAWPLTMLSIVRGKLTDGERRITEIVSVAEQVGIAGVALGGTIGRGNLNLWFRGDTVGSVRAVEDALEQYPLTSLATADRPYLDLASFFAAAGRPERAKEFIAEYETEVDPEVRRGNRASLYSTLGDIALAEKRYDDAVAEYRRWDREISCAICASASFAHAFDQAGQADSALARYEHYLTTPWLSRVYSDFFFRAFAFERLGALYEERGDTQKALYNYGKFVDLWEEADPELQPRVEAARRAMAALSSDR